MIVSCLLSQSFPSKNNQNYLRRSLNKLHLFQKNRILSTTNAFSQRSLDRWRISPSITKNRKEYGNNARRRLTSCSDVARFVPPNKSKPRKKWHEPYFMDSATPEDKDYWLESLIKTDEEVDAEAFHVVLDAWSYSDCSGYPQKTEYWISKMEDFHREKVISYFDPNKDDSNIRMLTLYSSIQPTIQSYNSVLRAWSNSKDEVSVVRGARWFNKLQDIPETLSGDKGKNDVKNVIVEQILKSDGTSDSVLAGPNTESFSLFLKICSRGQSKKKDIRFSNAMRAQKLLKIMKETHEESKNHHLVPNTECFNYVLTAWTKCNKDPSVGERVMELLREMETHQRNEDDPSQSKIRPNTASYTNALNAWGIVAAIKARQYNMKMKMKTHFETDIQKEYTPQDSKNALNGYDELLKAEAILSYMNELHSAGHQEVMPDTTAYNCLLKGWANISNETNKGAPLRAERVFRDMLEHQYDMSLNIEPDYISYSTIMLAWTRSKRGNSAKRAHWWFEKLKEEYRIKRDENLKPNTFAYNTLMRAYSQVHDPESVDKMLDELIDYEKQSRANIGPNTDSFALAIGAWTNFESYCVAEDAGQGYTRSFHWLNELILREEKGYDGICTVPEVYNNVLKAAKNSKKKDMDVLNYGMKAFSKHDRSRHHLDWINYQWLLEVGLKVLSEEQYNVKRMDFLKNVSRKCCEDGLLARGVLQAISNSSVYVDGWTFKRSQDAINVLFGEWPFPKSWSRNLKSQKHFPMNEDLIRRKQEVFGRGTNKNKNRIKSYE